MNTITQKIKQAVKTGTCSGTINSAETFNAGLVELEEKVFPPQHNEAYVMFARQRAGEPDYTTKEITLSFSKGQSNGSYDLTPAAYIVRLTFADNSDPAKPVIYTQSGGKAELEYDAANDVFSGKLISAVVENHDDDVAKTLTIDVEFLAKKNNATSSRSRTRAVAA
ncbi:hypothetical protein [Pseudomonas sp. A-RE-19]|uniref:hypothetical protein n=1 Tax=Pseudomonas sp. A-RE-19 TaxID=2832401 RepID=UPI001CBFD846|nr:hypothetical protein [Pseudomonas sp. A-RE-19]